jgi:hypothetical protein
VPPFVVFGKNEFVIAFKNPENCKDKKHPTGFHPNGHCFEEIEERCHYFILYGFNNISIS